MRVVKTTVQYFDERGKPIGQKKESTLTDKQKEKLKSKYDFGDEKSKVYYKEKSKHSS